MNRQLTNLEGLLTLTLLALGVCLTLACTGCATPRISPVQYEVKAFSIVVGPASYIQDMWETHFPFDTDQPTGSSANETLENGGEIR